MEWWQFSVGERKKGKKKKRGKGEREGRKEERKKGRKEREKGKKKKKKKKGKKGKHYCSNQELLTGVTSSKPLGKHPNNCLS